MPHSKQNAGSGHRNTLVGLFLVAGLALGGGAFFGTTLTDKTSAGISPTALYATQIQSIDGKPTSLGQWEGKTLLINFWATWCAPCREEIPHLIEAQQRYGARGLQVIGIAIDTPDKVASFSQKMGINYSILIDEEGGVALSKRLGNRAGVLPFTAIVDRRGHVTFVTTGAITGEQINEQIQKII